jgi:signal transduction histidine kinase
MPLPASRDASSLDESTSRPEAGSSAGETVSAASTFRRAAASTRRKTALDEQKRSFLRMVSHELRTPLNAVIGFSEIISCELYGPLGAPQYKEYAEMVRQSGLKMLKLVNQIVEIARLEGHVTDLDAGPEALDEAIEDIIDQLPEAKARGVEIVTPGAGSLPVVLADSRGLRTILSNLLQNAVSHSPDGGTVTIETRVTAARMVEIRIRDHGEGVESAELARMVRPFEQGGSALTRSNEGAGLGLPIVDLLSRAMGGALKLKSRPGDGFTAIVTLPLA